MWFKIHKECSNFHKNNERKYMCDQEIQRALPVITMMGSWQLLNLCTGRTVTQCLYSRTKECSSCYKNIEHIIIIIVIILIIIVIIRRMANPIFPVKFYINPSAYFTFIFPSYKNCKIPFLVHCFCFRCS